MLGRPAAGGWRAAPAQQRRSATPRKRKTQENRGEALFWRLVLGCIQCFSGTSPQSPHVRPILLGYLGLTVNFSKSCCKSLSFLASAFSATIFHCSVVTSQTAFSRESSILLSRHATYKVFRVITYWKFTFCFFPK